MLYSKIINDGVLYILLHAEQVFQDFTRFQHSNGYFTSEVTRDTIERIGNEIKLITDIKSLIIDCYLIDENEKSFNELSDIAHHCIKNEIKLSFIRISNSLLGTVHEPKFNSLVLEFDLIKKISNTELQNSTDLSTYDLKDINIPNFDDYIFDLYSNTILRKKIKSTYCKIKSTPYSKSSNVELPKYINIKTFIEEREISFLGIYLLCKKAFDLKWIPDLEARRNNKQPPTLFLNSMAGSYLASLFSKIAILDIAFLDHLGPKRKIYRRMQRDILKPDQEYIIIADVVCLGTEIERAKGIIEHEGGNIKKILTTVFIKVTDNTSEEYICSLFTLTKDNNEGIDYQIKTNFSEIKVIKENE